MTGLPTAAVEMYLDAQGLKTAWPGTVRRRGIGDAIDLARIPNRILVITRGAGPGLSTEWHIDRPLITLRAVGMQKNYDDAETFADWLDAHFITPYAANVGGYRALHIARAGGAMTHVLTDSSRRAHFQCSYVVPVASGL